MNLDLPSQNSDEQENSGYGKVLHATNESLILIPSGSQTRVRVSLARLEMTEGICKPYAEFI